MMETDRIFLRPWRDSDAESLFKYASDPDVGPRAGWPPHQSVAESLEVIRTVFHNETTWAIELKELGEAVGAMGYLPCEGNDLPSREGEPLVGYWVGKPYWNQGICTEALRLMIDHIRQTTDIRSLISSHFLDNPASGRVMEKCGFVATGETCVDETLAGSNRPMRVLRLEIKRLIAFCGFDCGKCDAYIATKNNKQALREKTAKLWAELNQAPILPEDINCEGCKMSGVKTVFCSSMCEIRKCAMAKGFETCGNCPEMDTCPIIAVIWQNNPQAKESLLK